MNWSRVFRLSKRRRTKYHAHVFWQCRHNQWSLEGRTKERNLKTNGKLKSRDCFQVETRTWSGMEGNDMICLISHASNPYLVDCIRKHDPGMFSTWECILIARQNLERISSQLKCVNLTVPLVKREKGNEPLKRLIVFNSLTSFEVPALTWRRHFEMWQFLLLDYIPSVGDRFWTRAHQMFHFDLGPTKLKPMVRTTHKKTRKKSGPNVGRNPLVADSWFRWW